MPSWPSIRTPAVVVDILAGIILGPSVLGLVEVDLPIQILALVGLAFPLFLAGLEIDAGGLHAREASLPLPRATSWGQIVGVADLEIISPGPDFEEE